MPSRQRVLWGSGADRSYADIAEQQLALETRFVRAVAIDRPPVIAVRSVAERLFYDKQTCLFLRDGFFFYT